MCSRRLFITVFLLASVFIPVEAFAQQYHLLIITPNEFVNELQPLKNWKDETGRPTIIKTLGQVYEINYGEVRDEPEQVKKFIEEYVVNHNVQHVMLVGDCDKFPVRYIKAYNTEWGDKWYPSDLYYMDLFNAGGQFDDWDGDGDNILGEVDFKGGTDIAKVNLDNIDMYPDVSVARVPASNKTEVANYVNKVLDYESAVHPVWFNKALLVVDGGAGPFGSTTKMDAIIPDLSGFPPDRFYQDDPPFDTMTFSQRADAINNSINMGAGFVNYHGHGNRTLWAGWYDSSQISGLKNSNGMSPIMLATSCYTGRFHFDREYYMDVNGTQWTGGSKNHPEPMPVQPSQYDTYANESMAEHLLVKNKTGAVGYIGCASKCEHGAWLGNDKGFTPYFYEEYDAGIRVLGGLWKRTLKKFIDDLFHPTTGGMYYYAFIHIHKMILFGDPSLALPVMPTPDIKANGSDIPITLSSNQTLSIKIELDAANQAGYNADWWLLAYTPFGWSFCFFGYWVPGIWVTYQGPLYDLGSLEVFKETNLAKGFYFVFFGVDTIMNGNFDVNDLYWDFVQVQVQ